MPFRWFDAVRHALGTQALKVDSCVERELALDRAVMFCKIRPFTRRGTIDEPLFG